MTASSAPGRTAIARYSEAIATHSSVSAITAGLHAIGSRRTANPSAVPKCANCGSRLPWAVDAGEGDFAEEVKAPVPVVVDFWAPWCGPCRSVAPIVDDLATQYAGKIKVAKINVDESTEVATRYQITSIPTFILFKDGQVKDRALGALPKSEFVKLIDRNL